MQNKDPVSLESATVNRKSRLSVANNAALKYACYPGRHGISESYVMHLLLGDMLVGSPMKLSDHQVKAMAIALDNDPQAACRPFRHSTLSEGTTIPPAV